MHCIISTIVVAFEINYLILSCCSSQYCCVTTSKIVHLKMSIYSEITVQVIQGHHQYCQSRRPVWLPISDL